MTTSSAAGRARERSAARIATSCAALLAASAGAQAPNPDPHWGAHAFPNARTGLRFSLSANRFTQFDGEGGTYPSTVDFTTGFQIGTLSWTDRHASDPRITYTLSLGVGASSDEPTRWLQNEFLHSIKGIEAVPVGETYSAFEATGGGSMTFWTDPVPRVAMSADGDPWRFGAFVGGGVSGGTLYQEMELHTGVYLQTPRVDLGLTRGAIRCGAMLRGSLNEAGAAFRDVSDHGLIAQVELGWVSDRLDLQPWWLLGAPNLSLAVTYDTGLFVEPDGDPIDGGFVSIRAEWPNGFRVETWNDMFADTDYGPSYGFLISFDVSSVFGVTPW